MKTIIDPMVGFRFSANTGTVLQNLYLQRGTDHDAKFDSVTGIVLIDRVAGTMHRQYLEGGLIKWEAVTTPLPGDIVFDAVNGPVYTDRDSGTMKRKYRSSGLYLKETVATRDVLDLTFDDAHGPVLIDRADLTIAKREYLNAGLEKLEAE